MTVEATLSPPSSFTPTLRNEVMAAHARRQPADPAVRRSRPSRPALMRPSRQSWPCSAERPPRRRLEVALIGCAAAAVGAALDVPAVHDLFFVGPSRRQGVANCGGVRFSLSVPRTGWRTARDRSHEATFHKKPVDQQEHSLEAQLQKAVIFLTGFRTPPRRPLRKLLGSAIGIVLRPRGGSRERHGPSSSSGPTQVTFGGSPAQHVELTVREDLSFEPEILLPWLWSIGVLGCVLTRQSNVSDTIRVRIVDVGGHGCSSKPSKNVTRDEAPVASAELGTSGEHEDRPIDPLRVADVSGFEPPEGWHSSPRGRRNRGDVNRAGGFVGNPTLVVGHERAVDLDDSVLWSRARAG